jgi:dihydrofolate reductase
MIPVVSLYIAGTLDGYIARANGAIDWLANIDENDTDYGYADFYNSIDALLMGSATFEMIQSFGAWPYGDKPTFVFTRRSLSTDLGNVYFVSGDPYQVIVSPECSSFQRLWLVGGSALIGSCMKKGIVNEYILTILPVLLGHGLCLFPSPAPEQWLNLVSCMQYERGVIQLHYHVQQPEG